MATGRNSTAPDVAGLDLNQVLLAFGQFTAQPSRTLSRLFVGHNARPTVPNVRFGSLADIGQSIRMSALPLKADMLSVDISLLSAISGHWAAGMG